MADRFFLYIDILGFKNLIKSGFDLRKIYDHIDRLNVHSDRDFTCIVFSDTIIVYGSDAWIRYPNQAVMWLIEFAQDLFYRLISLDIHIRAFVTRGDFKHYRMNNIEAYYGEALVRSYEIEKEIKCTGVFIDSGISKYSDIFFVDKYNKYVDYVHVMRHLDDVGNFGGPFPISGEYLVATGMEWWVAYLLKYIKNIHEHSTDLSLPLEVRQKYINALRMIGKRHNRLLKCLKANNFQFDHVIELDWTEPMRRIGTREGAFG